MENIKNIKYYSTRPLFELKGLRYPKAFAKFMILSATFFLSSYGTHASPLRYPAFYTPDVLLTALLNGEYHANKKAVKWLATPADIHEFNGQLGENNFLYSVVDTTMVIERATEKVYFIIFRTAPMVTNEEGEWVNANNCHVCGVKLGYCSYTIEGDSIYVQKFSRNFATHGSFGEKTYSLSIIDLGDGYELLKVDDPYEGMGTTSVSTRFYMDGELMLSMISKENNSGSRNKNEKGYYEFRTAFDYNRERHTITIRQTGYSIHEQTGKRMVTNKTKKLVVDDYTLQF